MMGMQPFLKKKGTENPIHSPERGGKGSRGQGDDGKLGLVGREHARSNR